MDHEQHHHHQDHFEDHSAGWQEHGGFHAHHQSAVQEYNGFNNYAPLPMEPIYASSMHPPQHPHPSPRPAHPQLQPLIMPQMPQWPSMLTSQSTYQPPLFPSAPIPITPATATPVSAGSTQTRTSTPRKTLTDTDRRRMCQYHEENPTVKQTEIGALFGVERSTVSKVLRQKDKYLYQDDGSRSPIKRSKSKFPDIERTLSNWARNHQRQGLPLTDAIIREKARFFARTVGNSESHLKTNSSSWLEKFKQKNHLTARKGSIVEESEGTSDSPSNAHTPGVVSPASPDTISPSNATMKAAGKSEENFKTESPDTFDLTSHQRGPVHSQSSTSLSSVFTDTAPSTFSPGTTSPTSLSSPFFTPDSACGTNPFLCNRQPANGQPGSDNFQRPRSQTFPLLVGVEHFMSPPSSSDALTPKFLSNGTLDSPHAEIPNGLPVIEEALSLSPTQVTCSMQPPPVPMETSGPMDDDSGSSSIESSPTTPSHEEAARALELVITFFQSQQAGLEPQDFITIGRLMEKIRIKDRSDSVTSVTGRVADPDFANTKLETVDINH